MKDLKLIESNGLIKVYETEKGEKVVNARELHEGLENKRQFADWIKQRLEEVDAVQNQDYIHISQICETSTGATTKKEYILKLSIAKEMAMLERNEKGKAYRKYLIEVEEKYKQQIPKISRELQAILFLDQKQQELDTRISSLEGNMTVDYAQQLKLNNAAKERVIKVTGGKFTAAYTTKGLRLRIFQAIWNDFKDYFQISTYKDTPSKDFKRALNYLKTWNPQGKLAREIEDWNAAEKEIQ